VNSSVKLLPSLNPFEVAIRWSRLNLISLIWLSTCSVGVVEIVMYFWRASIQEAFPYIAAHHLNLLPDTVAKILIAVIALKLVMGRKNCLFFGSDSGGERAASLYSLIATAKLNELDPKFYLRTVLDTVGEFRRNC
jgi:hypothetical protein